jgi:hypothetical protein
MKEERRKLGIWMKGWMEGRKIEGMDVLLTMVLKEGWIEKIRTGWLEKSAWRDNGGVTSFYSFKVS